ncbi:MAG TPA: MotA/TolQ/ExbB proton channel family protein [Pirellulaceae bacterium]|nr:MotA/TolQ/ExbB proton channel family protein [Pirellulaceae bacterium]HMO91262.1 MotA/TolQ/ExbB proton channel family protein [Pirellulaceae bacterium]HMP68554.1 MotA/TolQ/ExbB proton channel family protein [Pirellulaceae bacterium]
MKANLQPIDDDMVTVERSATSHARFDREFTPRGSSRRFGSATRPMVFALLLALSVVGLGSVALAPAQLVAQDQASTSPEGSDTPVAAPAKRNVLVWAFRSLGFYFVIFLALSFTLVALAVMNLLSARRDNICPDHLVEGFEANLNEKRYQEAYELAKSDESFLGNVLSSGLAKLSSGYSHAIEAMQEVGEEESMKLEHRLSYLALIGTISPMIGLLGTVHGMITSFNTIAQATGSPDSTKLAEGISTALVTTFAGLLIAIPAIAAYNILRNRIQRLVLDVGITSEGLMSRFENVGGDKKV